MMNIRTLANRKRVDVCLLSLVLLLCWCETGSAVAAEKSPDGKSKTAAIRATADAFAKAFDHGDAKAIAALWMENGTLADDEGRFFKGRKAIEDAYAAFFQQNAGLRMRIAVQSLDFPAPNMAIEDGIASVTTNESPRTASRYTAVHVLQDGKWLMASVRESPIDVPSNYSRLQQFAWLVGKWEAKSEDATVQNDIRWIANKSFLQRDYTVRQGGIITSSGMQIIGWEPQSGQIKSWSFDSSGGHGTGVWTPTPEGWHITSAGVLADGTTTSSQDFLIRIGGEDDVFGWRSFARRAGTSVLPDLPEAVMERLPEKR